MKATAICVASPERLNQYKVLYDSIKRHCKSLTPILYYGGNDIIRNQGLVVPVNEWVASSKYEEDWYKYTSIRPRAILHAFEEGFDEVVLLGADTEFFSPPFDFMNALHSADMVVTMYTYEPYNDEKAYPNNAQTIEVGQIQADMIGFRKTASTIKFLNWLAGQLEQHIVFNNGVYNKIYLDQGWLSLCFSFVENVKIMRQLGYNVGNYNLHNRGMCRFKSVSGETQWIMKDKAPLVLFHYAGFQKEKPSDISKHQNRYYADGDILQFLKDYGAKL